MAESLKYTWDHHWPIKIHTILINQSDLEASLSQARELDACDMQKSYHVDTSLVRIIAFMGMHERKIFWKLQNIDEY